MEAIKTGQINLAETAQCVRAILIKGFESVSLPLVISYLVLKNYTLLAGAGQMEGGDSRRGSLTAAGSIEQMLLLHAAVSSE